MSFLDPYAHLPLDKVNRVIADVSTEDFHLISNIKPFKGVRQTVFNILYSKLCNELRKRNITDHTRVDDFESFLVGCQLVDANDIIIPRAKSPADTDSEATLDDDRRRTPGGVDKNSPASHVPANPPKRTPRGDTRRTTSSKKTKSKGT